MGTITFLILLTISVVLHELGHFVAAKCFGIRVKRFCIFYDLGLRLFSTGKRFATEYRIGWLPLGGYVKFDIPDAGPQPKWSFMAQRPWKRFVVCIAGVVVNLVVAYSCLFAWERYYCFTDSRFSNTFVMERTWKASVRLVNSGRKYVAETYLPKSLLHSDKAKSQTPKTKKVHNLQKRNGKGTAHNQKPHSDTYVRSFDYQLFRLANLNLALFFFNLLPIPPLDGAQCLFSLYEMIVRRPLNEKVRIGLCVCGFLILIVFMVFDTFFFIKNLV